MLRSGNFNDHIHAFEKKLEQVVIADISAEPYCKRYLSHLLQHKKYYLAVYADVLVKLSGQSGLPAKDISLVDYGAGNGLLGIFAKFCGFKKVWINDIDERFIDASGKLADQLDVFIDGYITGDVEEVREYFSDEKPLAIIGTDVIEHIYDLEIFFSGLQQINPCIISVFTTASNPANYFKVRALKKIQQKDELEGGIPTDHLLFGKEPLEPFLKIREQIIQKYKPGLLLPEILQLAKATRGLNEPDIQNAVDQYTTDRKLPVLPPGFNTCNPLNSSWTERILSLQAYISLYGNAGFTCKFYAGFYNDCETGMKSFVKKLLNAGITILGKKISPYIVIVGFKK